MKCESCFSHLFLNDQKELECQYCGKIAKEIDITNKQFEELIKK